MFSQKKDYANMKPAEILIDVLEELDAIKRYVANTYDRTDTEVAEIRDLARKIDAQTRETDDQIDRIERYDRTLNEIKSSLKAIERKL